MSGSSTRAALMQEERRPRLVILQTHPIQYYAPLYSLLARRGRIDVHVVYLTDAGSTRHVDELFGIQFSWDIPLLEGYAHTILQPGTSIQGRSFLQRSDPRLEQVLEQLSPDWILTYGYANAFIWRALAWAKRRGIRTAYTSDSNLRDQRAGPRLLLKHALLRPFFCMQNLCFATSEANEAYLDHFGVAQGRIRRMPFAIDVRRFQEGAPHVGQRRKYDFIWAGKFIDLKKPSDFLRALASTAVGSSRQITAAIAGDGVLRNSLEAQAKSLPRNCELEFLGFVNQKAMPKVLQSANTLVFTSDYEPYGLIATEAAAAGLALVVAENIGCVSPSGLARPDVNALVYPRGNLAALTVQMERLINDTELLHGMQVASRKIAWEHDLAVAAEVIEGALAGPDIHRLQEDDDG